MVRNNGNLHWEYLLSPAPYSRQLLRDVNLLTWSWTCVASSLVGSKIIAWILSDFSYSFIKYSNGSKNERVFPVPVRDLKGIWFKNEYKMTYFTINSLFSWANIWKVYDWTGNKFSTPLFINLSFILSGRLSMLYDIPYYSISSAVYTSNPFLSLFLGLSWGLYWNLFWDDEPWSFGWENSSCFYIYIGYCKLKLSSS